MIALSLISMHIQTFFGHHSHHHQHDDQTHTPAAFNTEKEFSACIEAIKHSKKADGTPALNAKGRQQMDALKDSAVPSCNNRSQCFKEKLAPFKDNLNKFTECKKFLLKKGSGDGCALLASCMTFPLERRELFQNFL